MILCQVVKHWSRFPAISDLMTHKVRNSNTIVHEMLSLSYPKLSFWTRKVPFSSLTAEHHLCPVLLIFTPDASLYSVCGFWSGKTQNKIHKQTQRSRENEAEGKWMWWTGSTRSMLSVQKWVNTWPRKLKWKRNRFNVPDVFSSVLVWWWRLSSRGSERLAWPHSKLVCSCLMSKVKW